MCPPEPEAVCLSETFVQNIWPGGPQGETVKRLTGDPAEDAAATVLDRLYGSRLMSLR